MKWARRFIIGIAIVSLPLAAESVFAESAATTHTPSTACEQKTIDCAVGASTESFANFISQFPAPSIAAPANPRFATPTFTTNKPITRTVKYMVAKNGNITADFENFKTLVQDTYDNPNGWSRLGVRFERVDTGGQFTVILAEADLVPSYSSICDSVYSCTAGNNVVINQDRWQTATDPWNQAGGDLRNYRNMVVNHETGHWLGHGHQQCSGAGNPAAVMQQQSISLQGCKFNPWPLDSEIWSTTLGI